jgi:hypothetical protein
MGLVMNYEAYDKHSYEVSLDALRTGSDYFDKDSFDEDDVDEYDGDYWKALQETFGRKLATIDIDKAWNLLSILFEDSEIGQFITGSGDDTFYLDGTTLSIFSIEYLQLVCQFIENQDLTNKEVFLAHCRTSNEFTEDRGDYLHHHFKKLYDFYKQSVSSERWILGVLV